MKPIALAAQIGADLRMFRELNGRRQDDVARAARQAGLPWTRSVVVALEAGRRYLTVDELARVPRMLELLGVGAVDADLSISREGNVSLRLAHLHHSQNIKAPWAGSLATEARVQRALSVAFPWTHGERELEPAYEAAGGDLEQKVARRWRCDPLIVALIAQATWGRSLTQERDHRVTEQTPTGTARRALQALRGHVSRALLDELGPKLTEARKRLRRKGGPR